jgi:hypothetical protein
MIYTLILVIVWAREYYSTSLIIAELKFMVNSKNYSLPSNFKELSFH